MSLKPGMKYSNASMFTEKEISFHSVPVKGHLVDSVNLICCGLGFCYIA